jgi:CIC family chloride channel protein
MTAEEKKPSHFERLSLRFRRQLDRARPPDSLVLLATALVVGAGTGLLAVLLILLIRQLNDLSAWLRGSLLAPLGGIFSLIIIMGLAGLIVGWLVSRWAIEAKGTGIPEVMEAAALHGGRIRPRVAPAKMLASSITIGFGGSAGSIGPIVQIGASIGSWLGQIMRLSNDQVRTLLACGAAAGVAATFNAPIAGAIFALEVILGRFSTRHFGAVVISAVSADVIGRFALGDQPVFVVPAYTLSSFRELPIYVILALVSAVLAVLFIHLLHGLGSWFEGMKVHPAIVAAIGMVLTAIIIAPLPDRQVLGSGLAFIGEAISRDFSLSLGLMAAFFVLKILATSLTLGSGNSGGVFAPSLFLGAVLGGLFGTLAHSLFPGVVEHPGAYAIVGMAAFFAGATRAPITALLLVFEMSNDYKLILPLMLATVISTLLAEYLYGESVFTVKLSLKGIALHRDRDLDLMENLSVREAMSPAPYVVNQKLPLTELGLLFHKTHAHSFLVVDSDHRLVGMVSVSDYDQVTTVVDRVDLLVRDIATMGNIITAHEDESLSDIAQRIASRDIDQLPVVSRQDSHHIIGVIRRRDIASAYNLALTRRARQQAKIDRDSLEPIDGMEFIELEIQPGSHADNQSLATLASSHLPHDCVVVCVRRGSKTLIPHGDTILQPGDLLSVFLRREDEEKLCDCLGSTE